MNARHLAEKLNDTRTRRKMSYESLARHLNITTGAAYNFLQKQPLEEREERHLTVLTLRQMYISLALETGPEWQEVAANLVEYFLRQPDSKRLYWHLANDQDAHSFKDSAHVLSTKLSTLAAYNEWYLQHISDHLLNITRFCKSANKGGNRQLSMTLVHTLTNYFYPKFLRQDLHRDEAAAFDALVVYVLGYAVNPDALEKATHQTLAAA